MSVLRKNWFAILVIVIALLWWHIYDLFIPPLLDFEPSLNNVDYWSLISNPDWFWIGLIGFTCIASLSGIFIFLYIVPYWRGIYRLILLIVAFLLCTLSSCSSSALSAKAGRTIAHMMSVQYQGKVYQLAYTTYQSMMDEDPSAYYIFECDSSGRTCSKIDAIGLLCCDFDNVRLIVSDNKLILDRGSEQTQILPAVNGAS